MAARPGIHGAATTFHGYDIWKRGCKIVALYVDGARGGRSAGRDDVVVVLDHTPFYAESGGQVGDTGELPAAAHACR